MASIHPPLVLALTHFHDAWIVGGAADPNVGRPRDYDVVVPYRSWSAAAQLIPKNAEVNSFGGWKCSCGRAKVDVWPGDVSAVMLHPRCRWAWQPRHGIRLHRLCE
jgi:hypothetical protein